MLQTVGFRACAWQPAFSPHKLQNKTSNTRPGTASDPVKRSLEWRKRIKCFKIQWWQGETQVRKKTHTTTTTPSRYFGWKTKRINWTRLTRWQRKCWRMFLFYLLLLWWWWVVGGRSSPWVEADFEAVTAGLAGRNGHWLWTQKRSLNLRLPS